ncbi:MAG: hypothetical protein HQK53_18595 [Oligoflexia bacterium]|nr:hypothetical protein [Oligoflexia bacterium]MBF0411758.1 hypothetical protein [Desulfamplus sp.]
MKKKKNLKRPEREKISAMLLNVAEGYIDIGTTIEEKENLLRSACVAWNTSCLPFINREPTIKQYIEEFKTINNFDEETAKAHEGDIRLLIEQKETLYPDVNIQIVNARIEDAGEEYRVLVASVIGGI